jgi:hypothetical protein
VLITSWLLWFWYAARFKEFVLWADCCATRTPVSVLTPCGRDREHGQNADKGRRFEAFAAAFDRRSVEREMTEDGKWHSVFTWALLQGLKGAAARSDGAITSESLRDYLTNNMKRFLRDDQRQNTHVSQEPDFGKVEPITFRYGADPRRSQFPVMLRLPDAWVGERVKVVTTRSNPPAAETTLSTSCWQLHLEAGAYAVIGPRRRDVHAFTVAGEGANGVIVVA